HRLELRRLGEDVRPEPPHRARAGASAPARRELEHRAVQLDPLVLGAAQDEPRPADLPAAARAHPPAPRHPQVAAQDDAALEPEQEVLPDRLDRLEPPTVEALRDARELPARVWRGDLEPLADEQLEPP